MAPLNNDSAEESPKDARSHVRDGAGRPSLPMGHYEGLGSCPIHKRAVEKNHGVSWDRSKPDLLRSLKELYSPWKSKYAPLHLIIFGVPFLLTMMVRNVGSIL